MSDRDGFVAVVHSDMHLGAADQLLARQQLIVGKHLPVARGFGNLLFGGPRQRHGPRRYHAYAQFGGGIDQDPAVVDQFTVQSVQRIDHAGVRLDDAALQLSDVVVGQLGQQFGGARRQSPRLEIDKVKLLFDTQRSRRPVSHPPTVWATSYRHVKHWRRSSACRLLDGDRLGQVARLVDVVTAGLCHRRGENLQWDGRQQRLQKRRYRRDFKQVIRVRANRVVALLGDDDGDRATRLDFADVGQQLAVQHGRAL